MIELFGVTQVRSDELTEYLIYMQQLGFSGLYLAAVAPVSGRIPVRGFA